MKDEFVEELVDIHVTETEVIYLSKCLIGVDQSYVERVNRVTKKRGFFYYGDVESREYFNTITGRDRRDV